MFSRYINFTVMCDLLVNLKMNDFYMEFGVQNVKEPVISLFLK